MTFLQILYQNATLAMVNKWFIGLMCMVYANNISRYYWIMQNIAIVMCWYDIQHMNKNQMTCERITKSIILNTK